jgi:hypothetical protein
MMMQEVIRMTARSPIRVLLGLCVAIALSGCQAQQAQQQKETPGDIPEYGSNTISESDYRAVLLSNSMVLFGKLHGLGTPFPVLTDVYYVQSVEDPATKKPTNVLIKRGKEWHGPDRTVLNASQIIMVEPVARDSKVMQVITEAEKQK